ncbi:H-2 class I histocompatibility antigen, Q10 alpha chain-like [Erinaceus europaeus]|uniref:H-2 class I histocompatibility antigen, Q10 alpha chain-like n=1 Tax=Erinaceus europaeus TaxID=9365 RepID=A0A1S3WGW7_ERIEU|nr:H-2 class I histocompatibility antigen, Q10 alpha chain-like [Erinaceus europaeus]
MLMAELAHLKVDNKPWSRGTHSLRYHYLCLSEPGPALPQFLVIGYVNDQPFIRFDSREGRAKPQALWMTPIDAQYWEMETQKHQAWAKVQQVEMWTVMGYHNQSSGTHSAQIMFGCEIQEGGISSSFWQYGYDGQDHLTLDLETQSWVSANSVAWKTKRWWEREPCYAEYNKAYLGSLCLTSLHKYLELGGLNLTQRKPPTVQVTRHLAQDRGTTLRCWARGFYPRDISVSWWLGEEELSQETEWVETRPSGDGTYQTWAAVRVLRGMETQYSCQVQHSGLSQALTVAWELPSSSGLITTVLFCILATVLLGVGSLVLVRWYQQDRNKDSDYQLAPVDNGMSSLEEAVPRAPKPDCDC